MAAAPITTEQLWELLHERLASFLARHAPDGQTAEDLLQETFLRIHRGLDGLADGERLQSWVFQIARNLVIDERRARSAEVATEDLAEPVADEPDGDDNLNAVVRGWLPAMIARLPETYREAVRLFELEGLSQQAIADRLGLSLSGAKSRVRRGRERLKTQLFDCCVFERDARGNVVGYARRSSGECAPCERRSPGTPETRRGD